MGSYFARFFERNGHTVIVSDKGAQLSNIQLAKKADVIIVSVPISQTEKVIKEVAPHVKKTGLLMDFTSLKEFPMEEMKITEASYLGCHPMFGPTNSIEGQLVVLCKGEGMKWYRWWKELLLENKVEVRELTPKKHDQLMAYVQGLSHFSFLAMADVLRKSGFKITDFIQNQSPIYRLRLSMIGRILAQDPKLYGEIQTLNPYGADVLKLFEESIRDGMKLGEKEYEKWFEKSSRYFGAFKKQAMKESSWVIEQMNRKSVSSDAMLNDLPSSGNEVAALGPENTFSSFAAKAKFPQKSIWYASTISEVFEQVKKGKVKWGIVPIQNVLTGSVAETMNNLFESGLHVIDSFDQSVHHCLASLDYDRIKTIYSHSQPLKQCKNYLKKYYPKVQLIAMPSTTAAITKIIQDDEYGAGVICAEEAAKEANLKVLKKGIQDYRSNSTRFVVISKKSFSKRPKYPITMIAFYFSADAPGTLYQVLGEFSGHGINMTKIESQANPEIPGGHVFYVDFEGHPTDSNVKKMLSSVRRQVAELRVLGGFSIRS